jgi:electron transport complex protein RnfG
MPAEAYDNDPLQERIAVCSPLLGGPGPQDLYLVRKSGQPVAMALNVTAPDGYAGAIELLVVVRTDGSLAGVRVQEHRETPGLGDLIEIGKSGWIEKFKDLSLVYPTPARWKLKRYGGHFDQFAGATITPAAVVEAVRKCLWFFRDQGKELLTTQNEAMPCDGSCREATCPK